jgi:hypothetical protein
VEKEELTEEQPQVSTTKCSESVQTVASPSPILPMPTISALSAHSVTAASSPLVVFAHKSTSVEVKLRKAEEENEEDEDADEEEEEEEEEEDDDGDGEVEDEEDLVQDDTKSNTPPLKRERRKAGARKAISREFIESDEDSPEDPGASNDSTPNKAIDEEKLSSDSTPSETADDDDPTEKNNDAESLLALRKPSSNCSGLLKLQKTDEDLDVCLFFPLLL